MEDIRIELKIIWRFSQPFGNRGVIATVDWQTSQAIATGSGQLLLRLEDFAAAAPQAQAPPPGRIGTPLPQAQAAPPGGNSKSHGLPRFSNPPKKGPRAQETDKGTGLQKPKKDYSCCFASERSCQAKSVECFNLDTTNFLDSVHMKSRQSLIQLKLLVNRDQLIVIIR